MAPQSLNLVSLVLVDKRTKVLAIIRDLDLQVRVGIAIMTGSPIDTSLKHQNIAFEYFKSAYGYNILWLRYKIIKINHSDNVSKVRKNPFQAPGNNKFG